MDVRIIVRVSDILCCIRYVGVIYVGVHVRGAFTVEFLFFCF